MTTGYISLVLHAHLPYVRHPEHEDFLEESWLYEAITETYLPLLRMMDNLTRDGVHFRLTMSLSPSLMGMLVDPLLQDRYVRHINRLLELSWKEVERTRGSEKFHELAVMYHNHFLESREMFCDWYGKNLVTGFRKFLEDGSLEIVTCGATHGLLTMMRGVPSAIHRQLGVAVRMHEKHLGRAPQGIWLPECSYYEGLDQFLAEHGIRYFFVDTHGLQLGNPQPVFDVYSPVYTPSGPAAFGRDPESSVQVWSGEQGYPGDPVYRDFYRDIGFDLPVEYVGPYIHQGHIPTFTGIKYYAITGKTDHKKPYNFLQARDRAAEHAGNFLFNRQQQVKWLNGQMGGRPPLVVSPYDAELFGHWWFEGPLFLEYFFRKAHFDQSELAPITPPEYLDAQPVCQMVQPSESSWGANGYADFWVNETNDWVYPHLVGCARHMDKLDEWFKAPSGGQRKILNQMRRELLLAQASDWAFIMRTKTNVDYAIKRTKDHVLNFLTLREQLIQNRIDWKFVDELEWKNNLFGDDVI